MTRVLVTYASKHGSTAEIAEAIAAELRTHGLTVDSADATEASPAGFDAVVLGSAVYVGRWRREARRFLKTNLDALRAVPFWIFSSGPAGEKAAEDLAENGKWLEPHKVLALAESAGVRGHTVFSGRVPVDPHGFVEESMVRNTPAEFQDSRDWDEIQRWAAGIASELTSE